MHMPEHCSRRQGDVSSHRDEVSSLLSGMRFLLYFSTCRMRCLYCSALLRSRDEVSLLFSSSLLDAGRRCLYCSPLFSWMPEGGVFTVLLLFPGCRKEVSLLFFSSSRDGGRRCLYCSSLLFPGCRKEVSLLLVSSPLRMPEGGVFTDRLFSSSQEQGGGVFTARLFSSSPLRTVKRGSPGLLEPLRTVKRGSPGLLGLRGAEPVYPPRVVGTPHSTL